MGEEMIVQVCNKPQNLKFGHLFGLCGHLILKMTSYSPWGVKALKMQIKQLWEIKKML